MVPADRLPLRRILASLSFPRSGSGFREVARCGWPGSLPARTRPPALAFALRLALLPLPPASAECQEVPVAGAPPARHPLSAHLEAGSTQAIPVHRAQGVAAGSWHALPPQWACPVALGATAAVGLDRPGPGRQGRRPAWSQRYGLVFPHGLGRCVWWTGLASEPRTAVSCQRHGGLPQRPVCWPLQRLWLGHVSCSLSCRVLLSIVGGTAF